MSRQTTPPPTTAHPLAEMVGKEILLQTNLVYSGVLKGVGENFCVLDNAVVIGSTVQGRTLYIRIDRIKHATLLRPWGESA